MIDDDVLALDVRVKEEQKALTRLKTAMGEVIVGQEYQNADYIYTAFISEVDINGNDKYKIPNNFTKIDEFILDGIRVYEVFKRTQ